MKRIIIDILFFTSLFLLPWWLIVILSFVLLFIFENYVEVFFVGIVLDALYGIPHVTFFHTNMLFTFGAVAAFVIIAVAKRNLSIYS